MHEVGLVQAAIAQALEAAQRTGARRVERLTFSVAADGHITVETLQTLVDALARGTPIEGAVVNIESGSADDHELALTSIDVEVDAACVV